MALFSGRFKNILESKRFSKYFIGVCIVTDHSVCLWKRLAGYTVCVCVWVLIAVHLVVCVQWFYRLHNEVEYALARDKSNPYETIYMPMTRPWDPPLLVWNKPNFGLLSKSYLFILGKPEL